MCRVIFHTNAEQGFSKSGSDLFRIKETQNRKIQKYINTNDTEYIEAMCIQTQRSSKSGKKLSFEVPLGCAIVLYRRTEYQIYVYL